MKRTLGIALAATCAAALFAAPATAAPLTLFSTSGANAAAIQGTVDNFRTALGALNAPAPVNNADGRREINWDAAPDAVSAPNAFPGDFFNFNAAPRARGMTFTTPGTGFQLSATAASGVGVEFDNLNINNSGQFDVFSAERLFTPIGSNIVDVFFRNPTNTAQAALVDGFGAVFTDVDSVGVTQMNFFDAGGNLLISQAAQAFDGGLSFVGQTFTTSELARVQIILGDAVIGADDVSNGGTGDVVALDDFIAGEMQVAAPTAAPVPATLALLVVGFAGLGFLRRRPA